MSEARAAILFQYERLIDTIIDFYNGVTLKLVVDLGFKDKDNNKKRIYEEFRYNSSKYKNESSLITAKRNFTYYLRIDYPSNSSLGYKLENIIIPVYAILGLRDKVKEFDNILFDPYYLKSDNTLQIASNKIITVISRPMKNSTIEFSHSLYEGKDKDDLDYGVNIGLNKEFYFTIRSITKWKEFVYIIQTCDLYLWASQLIAPYITQLVGNSISDTGNYSSNKRYIIETTYEPEDYMYDNDSSKIIKTKPLDQESKIKSFFDD